MNRSRTVEPLDREGAEDVSTLRLPAGTEEYLNVPVTLERGKSDPTTSEVEVALVGANGSPVEDDWKPGEWALGGPPHLARILVGPGKETDSVAGT